MGYLNCGISKGDISFLGFGHRSKHGYLASFDNKSHNFLKRIESFFWVYGIHLLKNNNLFLVEEKGVV